MTTVARVEGISDRTLTRLIRYGAIALGVMLVAFVAIYYKGQHVDSGPSLGERQIDSAEQAVRQAPQNVAARLSLAATYLKDGRPDAALTQYDEILRAVPGNRAALLGAGTATMQNGDLDGAVTLFTKVVAGTKNVEFSNVDPQLQTAYYWLGSIAAQRGNYDDAVKNIRASLKVDDSDADSWYLLGTLQIKQGDPKGAVASLQRAIAFVPTGWCEPYTALGGAYTAMKAPQLAEYAGAMVDFCTKNPGNATKRLSALISGPAAIDAMLGLGLIAETQSDRAAAVDWYRKVLVADPTNTNATTALGRLDATGAPTTQPKAG
jgi:tetratricopeptide (TPR) repeat protein